MLLVIRWTLLSTAHMYDYCGGDSDEDTLGRMAGSIIDFAPCVSKALHAARFSTAPIEDVHAKHRQAASADDQAVGYTRFAATSVNSRSAEVGVSEAVGLQVAPPKAATPRARNTGLALVDRLAVYKKIPAPAMLYRVEWNAEQRAMDKSFDPITTASWAAFSRAWDKLEDENKARYGEVHEIATALKKQAIPLCDLVTDRSIVAHNSEAQNSDATPLCDLVTDSSIVTHNSEAQHSEASSLLLKGLRLCRPPPKRKPAKISLET